jgi:hypothetical protein
MLPSYATDCDAVLKDVPNDTQWRSHGVPNYTKVNMFFDKYKSTDHAPGSLEAIVQNVVKNWEKGEMYNI